MKVLFNITQVGVKLDANYLNPAYLTCGKHPWEIPVFCYG